MYKLKATKILNEERWEIESELFGILTLWSQIENQNQSRRRKGWREDEEQKRKKTHIKY